MPFADLRRRMAAVVAKSAEFGVERICRTLAFRCQPQVVKMPRAD
jgi:hypothetical protein